jgi:hypothetical protein
MPEQYTIENFAVIGLGSFAAFLVVFLWEWFPVLFRRYVVVKRYDDSNDSDDDGELGASQAVPTSSEPLVPVAVPPLPNAASTSSDVIATIRTRADLLDILARVKVGDDYVLSANKIAELFIGSGSAFAASRSTILDEIAAIRHSGTAPAPVCRSTMHRRPPSLDVLDVIESFDEDGRTVRCDPYGKRYTVGDDGRRNYLKEA